MPQSLALLVQQYLRRHSDFFAAENNRLNIHVGYWMLHVAILLEIILRLDEDSCDEARGDLSGQVEL